MDIKGGRVLCSNLEKATLLWEEYRRRIGCTYHITMHFNLQKLVQKHDLHQIEEIVTKEDIHMVIKTPPLEKNSRPRWFQWGFFEKNVGLLFRKISMNFAWTFSMALWTFM
jgi:hypothetical protein